MIIAEHTRQKVNSAEAVERILRPILQAEHEIDREKEHFWVIGLDVKNQVKYIDLVSLGILTATLTAPREVFRLAIVRAIDRIIVGHNHPSDDITPSAEDLCITKTLVEAGKIIGINVLDHVIIGNSFGYYSMNANGQI
jgi:DNA repair protein RadC